MVSFTRKFPALISYSFLIIEPKLINHFRARHDTKENGNRQQKNLLSNDSPVNRMDESLFFEVHANGDG